MTDYEFEVFIETTKDIATFATEDAVKEIEKLISQAVEVKNDFFVYSDGYSELDRLISLLKGAKKQIELANEIINI